MFLFNLMPYAWRGRLQALGHLIVQSIIVTDITQKESKLMIRPHQTQRFGIRAFYSFSLSIILLVGLTQDAQASEEGGLIQNSAGDGVYLSSSNGNTITNVSVLTNAAQGISLQASSNNTLSGNTANSNSGAGVRLFSNSTANTVSANTCNSNLNYGILLLSSSDRNVVSGCPMIRRNE
jgi:parallel beta-helix repeat protein